MSLELGPKMLFILVLTVIIPLISCEHLLNDDLWTDDAVRFNNHKLYSVVIESSQDAVEKLRSLRESMDIDFWNEPELNKKINFRVPPMYQEGVETFLNSSSYKYNIITSDLQKWIDRERAENRETDFLSGRQDTTNFALDQYHTYEEVSRNERQL